MSNTARDRQPPAPHLAPIMTSLEQHEQQQQHEPQPQVGVDELHEELDTTPVHAAARAGHVEELRDILQGDPAQAGALDKYGLTPLHWACDRGQAEAARLLLERGADADAVEKRMFKRRPLHFAVLASSTATVRELLVRHGADPRRGLQRRRRLARGAAGRRGQRHHAAHGSARDGAACGRQPGPRGGCSAAAGAQPYRRDPAGAGGRRGRHGGAGGLAQRLRGRCVSAPAGRAAE
jgi:hypothetical protein